jgi:hypothetical protein
MDERLIITRDRPLRDLIALGREAAAILRDRGADARNLALADALDGAAADVAVDISEPARIPIPATRTALPV